MKITYRLRCLLTLPFLLLLLTNLYAQNKIELTENLNYGQEDLIVDDSITAGGATFSRISDITVGDDNLYVLDSDFKKIAVFNKKTGSFERVILGGFGRGPGEFSLPMSITVNSNDQIVVYDYNNAKLSFFTNEGENIDEITVPVSTRSISFADKKIWFGSMNRNDYYLFSLSKKESTVTFNHLNGHINVSDEDLDYTAQGVISFIDNIDYQKIVVASHRPSVWYRINNGTISQFGSEIYPDAKATLGADGVRRIENHTAGICQLNSKYIVILWLHRPDNKKERYISLDFYFSNGKFIGREKIDMKLLHTHLTCDRNSNNIYLDSLRPYPRVVRYKVSID